MVGSAVVRCGRACILSDVREKIQSLRRYSGFPMLRGMEDAARQREIEMLERIERRDYRTVADVPALVDRRHFAQECYFVVLSLEGVERLKFLRDVYG